VGAWYGSTQVPPAIRLSNPEIPPAVDAVVARALAKAPEDRFASMGDLVRAFDSAVP
jgi:serine/threonine-protein kinase